MGNGKPSLWDRFLRRTETFGERVDNFIAPEPTEEEIRKFREEMDEEDVEQLMENAWRRFAFFTVAFLFIVLIGFVYDAWTFIDDLKVLWELIG